MQFLVLSIALLAPCSLSAEEAKKAPLPPLPWHMADIWWSFDGPTKNFESLEMDVAIDRDVPDTVCLYVSPCGLAQINGLDFYGGLQSNINGWVNGTDKTRVHRGKGAIFSRWSSDKKTPIGLEHVRTAAADCLVESAGYEGEFASVRRPFAWPKGTYTYQIKKGASEKVGDKDCTWFTCSVKDSAGVVFEVGSLRFEGTDFTFWARHSAFVEIYSTAKTPRSVVPEVVVTFGYPRINGKAPAFKSASVVHPTGREQSASPDLCRVVADGEKVVATIGPIFQRDPKDQRHALDIKAPKE
jgi:hypothetical protein